MEASMFGVPEVGVIEGSLIEALFDALVRLLRKAALCSKVAEEGFLVSCAFTVQFSQFLLSDDCGEALRAAREGCPILQEVTIHTVDADIFLLPTKAVFVHILGVPPVVLDCL